MRQLKRYVLKRNVCDGLEAGHPWVFRDKVGDDKGLVDGDWLQLVDPYNVVVGTGVYQAEGGVAIRVFRQGHRPVTVDWLKRQLEVAMEKRAELRETTDAYRILNGENDGFPGIVMDVYAGVGVLQTYAPGVDALGRYLAGLVADRLELSSLIWKAPSKRVGGQGFSNRVLRGYRPYVVKFHEGELELAADLFSGQKSGTYLDLRGLRRFLASQDLRGKKVLNLFAYTGAAGLACAMAGAREVVNVDQAQPSLDFGRRYHKHQAMKWVGADVFNWINDLPSREYDLIIADPPSMASNKTHVIKALKTYHRLYSTLIAKLKPGGTIVACCCTSRISPREFEDKVSVALRPLSRKLAMPMEPDHQPAFSEADYLKVLVFRQDGPIPTPERPARGKASAGKSTPGKAEGEKPGAGRAAAKDKSKSPHGSGSGKPAFKKPTSKKPAYKPAPSKYAPSRPASSKARGERAPHEAPAKSSPFQRPAPQSKGGSGKGFKGGFGSKTGGKFKPGGAKPRRK